MPTLDDLGPGHQRVVATVHYSHVTLDVRVANNSEAATNGHPTLVKSCSDVLKFFRSIEEIKLNFWCGRRLGTQEIVVEPN